MRNNNLKSEIKVKQINPNFRLFLFIIFNWYITIIPFVLPICMIILISKEKNYNLIWAMIFLFVSLSPILFHRLFIMGIGIKYLQEN